MIAVIFMKTTPPSLTTIVSLVALKTAQAKFSPKAIWLITEIQLLNKFSACVFYLNIFLYACSKCIVLPNTDCIIKHNNYAELFWMFVWFFEQLTKDNNGCLVNLVHFLHFTQYHLKYCIFWLHRSTRP